jgi:hypothetical protein
MPQFDVSSIPKTLFQEILGYLNFSSGISDPRFLANLNQLFGRIEEAAPQAESWKLAYELLTERLTELAQSSAAFQESDQARSVLQLAFQEVLPKYLEHHRDLLFHQSAAGLFRPFFVGRVIEVVLKEGGPWEETERIIRAADAALNDFIGHRPVAVLHNRRKVEPYAHERVRPVPLYISGARISVGAYAQLVQGALDVLRAADPGILRVAYFDPNLLDELAFDPRAYDFNHPVNKRPNYHFGQWDPHHIDNQGRFRRFVVQQTLLDALLERVDSASELPRDELLSEASVVLAGTILMASGTSGSGPETFDSSVTLSTLLPQIAQYRDEFYRQVLARMDGAHAQRLRDEAVSLRQPFAAARQHLNAQLARRRALQLQHVHLAIQFARLGYSDAAMRQANVVPTASARMLCKIHCLVTAAEHAMDRGKLSQALELLPQAESLLDSGIQCGAIVDPWNILGFGGQFSLFPSPENSVPDLRVDDLLELIEHIFNLYARLWHAAVVADDQVTHAKAAELLKARAEWWDRFATSSVSGVKRVAGRENYEAAAHVADALAAWHKAGAAAADTAFWRPHVEKFDSPHTYARVVEALLEKQRLAESQALLMHWLSQADNVALEEGSSSLYRLAAELLRQMIDQAFSCAKPCGDSGQATAARADQSAAQSSAALRRPIERFFDHLEANADTLWQVPELETASALLGDAAAGETADEREEDGDDIYQAAYEDVVYRDSTGDGIDADMLEAGGDITDYELEGESSRLATRLAFLATVARLWKSVAVMAADWQSRHDSTGDQATHGDNRDNPLASSASMRSWRQQAVANCERLSELMQTIERQPLVASSSSQEALVEYDRRRVIKETLLEKVIATSVAMREAQLLFDSLLQAGEAPKAPADLEEFWRQSTALWSALIHSDAQQIRNLWPAFLSQIRRLALLYVPLTKGGDTRKITAARSLQQNFRELLRRLPRLGLLRETCQLIQAARAMERDHPMGAGAVTEFDRLFEVGYKAIVESLVESSSSWPAANREAGETADSRLIDALQQVTESLLSEWLTHSRTLRLSVLEKVAGEKDWEGLLKFVERYGRDLFTQRFFNLANLRAILHQGVDRWLDQLAADPEAGDELSLINDLDQSLPRADAKRHLGLVIEAVVENFAEYRDYNATTTQSDRGELVYMLLDFLRVKVAYERIHWNLRPVMMAHEVLVRHGRAGAAELWRQAMTERTADTAEQHLRRLTQLQKKYGMRLPTVADRLAERFVRPLTIDRVTALVRPAAERSRHGEPSAEFEQLEREAVALADEPTGAGLDLPDWLMSLEEEVDRACSPGVRVDLPAELIDRVPIVRLSWDEIQQQLANWEVKFLEDKS